MYHKIFNVAQIRKIDKETIKEQGITAYQLMQRAGEKIALRLEEIIEKNRFDISNLYVFCGRGNNGGDGVELAKYFKEKYCVYVVLLKKWQIIGKPSKGFGKARGQYL